MTLSQAKVVVMIHTNCIAHTNASKLPILHAVRNVYNILVNYETIKVYYYIDSEIFQKLKLFYMNINEA